MAKAPAAPPKKKAASVASGSADLSENLTSARAEAPPDSPPATLQISRVTWSKGAVIHRVHQDQYAADQFNPGVKGAARFSPIRNKDGEPIPTLYGGSTFECAAMETVFHDVPFSSGYKAYDKSKLDEQVHSLVQINQDLVLADLGSKALRKLGVQRSQLIDTEKDQYPRTRKWAEAIHAESSEIQGLCWTSRQDDGANAIVLFGDRISPDALQPHGPSRSLISDTSAYGELLDLAEKIGVDIVAGKS